MKIVNMDFPNIEEGGLMFEPQDRVKGLESGFSLILNNTKTGKANFTTFRLINFASEWPESFSNEEEKELLQIAFLLDEAQKKVKPVSMSVCDRHPWPTPRPRDGEMRYGSYAKFHTDNPEDYKKLHALSGEDTQKLIDNGFFKKDTIVTYKEAVEFLNNLRCANSDKHPPRKANGKGEKDD